MAESLEFTDATEETTLLTEEGSLKARALEVREGDFSTVTLPLDDSCREHSRYRNVKPENHFDSHNLSLKKCYQ